MLSNLSDVHVVASSCESLYASWLCLRRHHGYGDQEMRNQKRGQVGRWVDLAKVSVGPVMEADGDRVQTSEAEDTRPNTSRPDVK